ncbi:MAG TPA: glycoside hydrolase family 32 protein [Puia sp.]|nr:glycoside hydrolase family 32 protein [Puia sp.]
MKNNPRPKLALWMAILAGVYAMSCPALSIAQKLPPGKLPQSEEPAPVYKEPFRPQLHFSPREKWMNDPNGMVWFHGAYHLFFQHYPGDIVWGPMHWGHAVSKDLIHWRQLPIALYPDSLGYIFSGSVVVDSNNTTGFGTKGQTPLVAIFTHHDPIGEKKGSLNYQNQSLAYSLDAGRTWAKYKNNPVLKNPGIIDFRDPNVQWYRPANKWIMSLATKDCISFYSSPDLKNWDKESEFGKSSGAHGGVWECPNLFPLKLEDTTFWVLLVSTNPGGPNGGSGTQYFIGHFDGREFHPLGNATKWIDYGPDDYAGVTWNNTGRRKIFLGWMSNWIYANQVPTREWRNAMTIPRDLKLQRVGEEIYLTSQPVKEINRLAAAGAVHLKDISIDNTVDLSDKWQDSSNRYILTLHAAAIKDFFIAFSNAKGEQLAIGYDKASNHYYIDRIQSGITNFNKEFSKKYSAPRISTEKELNLTLIMDATSLELFADKGLTVMTSIFFPEKPYTQIHIGSNDHLLIQQLSWTPLRSIW